MTSKRLWILISIILFFTVNCFAASTSSDSDAKMLKHIMPSVVNIRSQYRPMNLIPQPGTEKKQPDNNNNPGNQPYPQMSVASGVIVDAKLGYILTNVHAVEDAQIVTVTLSDGRHYTAKIIGTDKPSDIALLQIKAKNLTAMPIADSNDLDVGDKVLAIGNPFGLGQSVTSGIISALGRTTLGIENYENFIQTDAPINPGNSGGALINTEGQLIGINSAIVVPGMGTGIAFAIPANMAKSVMMQLIQYGNVKRGVLGIGTQNITPELASAFKLNIDNGSVITLVMSDTPAAKVGLQIGDVITSINGATIKNANDVINAIAFLRVDSKASITVLRGGKSITYTTIITDPQKRKQTQEAQNPFLYGVALKNFTLLSPIHGSIKGVLVVDVDQDSNAWHSDLRPGDVIVSAGQEKAINIDNLNKIASKAQDALLLNILRGPGALFLVINKEV